MAMKSQVLERDADLVSEDNVWRADLLTDTDPTVLPSTLIPQPQDILPTFFRANMIIDQARECQDTAASETGWISQGHGPLLVLACHLSRHRKRARSVDLTRARCPARLEVHHRVLKTGKMVDLGICLHPSPALREACKDIESEADGESRYFNHTDFEQTARTPLAISVLTKRQDQGGEQADLQLSVWADAHLERLAELRRGDLGADDCVIWLPLLKVIGPIWCLLLAREDYNERGELFGTTVYSRYQLGDVSTYHGFFRVLSAIQAVVDWAGMSYRPWFERWVSNV